MPGARIIVDPSDHLVVPDEPIIPVVSGVGWAAQAATTARQRIDEAIACAYAGRRRIHWLPLAAGEASVRTLRTPVPDATLEAIRVHRVAFVAPLPPVDDDARTLESELSEILDLYLGFAPIGPDGATLLCWENRETSAANLALEEGGSDSVIASSALAAARGQLGAKQPEPGWALSVASRLGTHRFAKAAVQQASRHFETSNIAVVEGETAGDATFARWVIDASPAPVDALSLSSALSALLRMQKNKTSLPSVVLSSATNAVHLLRLAHATSQGALASGRSHPQTGHCVIGPLRNDMSEDWGGRAMSDASLLLLRHLGWTEAADVFGNTEVAQAS